MNHNLQSQKYHSTYTNMTLASARAYDVRPLFFCRMSTMLTEEWMEWLAVSGNSIPTARHRDSYHIIPQPLQIATVIGTEHVRRGERISERRGIMRAQVEDWKKKKEERGWIGEMIRSKTRRLIHNANCYKD